jgi:homoserine dehydrogenase
MQSAKIHATVALLGFGNVGQSFARYVLAGGVDKSLDIKIKAVADSSGGLLIDDDQSIGRLLNDKASGQRISEILPDHLIANHREYIDAIYAAGIRILVESLPTNMIDGQPALGLIASALARGITVVTVDKGPLVHGFDLLEQTAHEGGARLGTSGTTGVAIPPELSGDRVLEIRGVLNGTTNYILSEMQQHQKPFEEALAQAQVDGIAEPHPSLDVDGWDTVAKTLILAKTLMGAKTRLAEVSRIGIGAETESLIKIGRESGRLVRLVGRARIWQGKVRVSVAPKLVGEDSPFYSVSGTSKVATFRTENRGVVLAKARSGRYAISQTIVDDIVRLGAEP